MATGANIDFAPTLWNTKRMKNGKRQMLERKLKSGKSRGTVLAEQMRADGNKLTDAQRENLGQDFLKLFYGGNLKPATTRRR